MKMHFQKNKYLSQGEPRHFPWEICQSRPGGADPPPWNVQGWFPAVTSGKVRGQAAQTSHGLARPLAARHLLGPCFARHWHARGDAEEPSQNRRAFVWTFPLCGQGQVRE